MDLNTRIQSHYSDGAVRSRLETALSMSGLGNAQIDWRQLAFADQFHAGGLEACKEIASRLDVREGDRVLDVGSGFGGPARYLAGAYGCTVVGVDLTPEYVDVATYLTDRTGQQDRVSFRQADALDLPFENAGFDHAWSQHVGMNIRDKEGFYAEIARVLKQGGRLAIYDIVRTGVEEPTYPLPWASDPDSSFLIGATDLTHALHNAGFEVIVHENLTPLVLKSFAAIAQAMPSPNSSPLNLIALLGGGAQAAIRNLADHLKAGRLEAHLFIACKPQSEVVHVS
jgi:sarcosine/dimethylglycine N-methyltransferase